MSRTYSPAQTAYLLALATEEAVKAEAREVTIAFDAYCDRETEGMSEDEATAWLRAQCENAQPNPVLVRYSEASRALAAAEVALVEWSIAVALRAARTRSEREAAEVCRDRGMRSYSARPKLVALAMQLNA